MYPPTYSVIIMYQFYDSNIMMQMLGITLSIHNTEVCYIYVQKQSIVMQYILLSRHIDCI